MPQQKTRSFLRFILLLLLAAIPARAQGPANSPPPANVSGTILDPTGVPYNTGYIRFDLIPAGGPVPCVGTPCTSINGHYGNVYLDGNGHFQMNLYPNSLITPGGTQWQITVSEPGNPAPWCFGPQSFTTAVTIPNSATVDLSATLSALAPQLCRNGSSTSNITIYHNGTLVGVEPGVNIVDTGSVTATVTDVPGSHFVSVSNAAAGSGTGCLLPGIDKVVLFEHPIGTCDGTTQFTWDVTNANLQIRNGSQSNTVGTNNTYTIGGANNLTGSTFVYTLGDLNASNGGTHQNEIYLLGSENTIQNLALSMGSFSGGNDASISIGYGNSIGSATANDGGLTSFQFGFESTFFRTAFVMALGDAGVGITGSTGAVEEGVAVGGLFLANCIQNSCGGGSTAGSATIQGFGIFGDNNLLNRNGNGNISLAYIGGYNNRMDTTLGALSGGSTIWGFDNENDGAVGNDVQIFGASNTAHNSGTATCLGASDSAIGGALNVVTGSSNYMVFGGGNVVTSHTCVAIFGDNITATANNTAYYGMSPTAGLVITASNGLGTGFDNVQRSPLIFSHLPTCAPGTEGSYAAITDSTTATSGATILGGSTHHVLGYCNGTNWQVVVGI